MFPKALRLAALSLLVCAPLAAETLPDYLKSAVRRHPNWQVGVSVWSIDKTTTVEKNEVGASRPMALASVFKLPVLFELMRQIEGGENGLSLKKQLTINESDKCVGSGRLSQRASGSKVTVDTCVELMETISDNTATDMIFRAIGFESVNRFCKEQGCLHTDVLLTNRAAWLLTLGQFSEINGLEPSEIASFWKKLTSSQRLAAANKVEKENRGLSLRKFQALEDASNQQTHEENVLLATTVENFSSASDLALLLTKLYQGTLLKPNSAQYCLGVLSRQKFNSRIPKYIPSGVTIYHKTGTLAGVVNDAGIVQLPNGKAIVIVALVNNIGPGEDSSASDFIAAISKRAYDTYR